MIWSLQPWQSSCSADRMRLACIRAFRLESLDDFVMDMDMTQHLTIALPEARVMEAGHWARKSGICSPGVDVKLIYSSFVWRHIVRKVVDCPRAQVLELLPGKSRAVPLGLVSAGMSCDLVRCDRNIEVIQDPQNLARVNTTRWAVDLYSPDMDWGNYDLVVGNHIIDDLLVASWNDTTYVDGFGDPASTEKLWHDFRHSADYLNEIQRLTARLCNLVMTLKSGARLLLREYPSSFALVNRIADQITAHGEAFGMLKSGLDGLPGLLTTENLSSITVPQISKIPGTVIRYEA